MNFHQFLEARQKKITPEEISAAELGKSAFGRGEKCIAGLDLALLELIKKTGGPVSVRLSLYDAWMRGWHLANLAEPII